MIAAFLSVFFFSSFLFGLALAAEAPLEPATLLGKAPPYAPRNIDYAFETGLMTGKDDLFWNAISIGRHLGTCPFTSSETCQIYLDSVLGAGVRESETQWLGLVGLRWQFVNFPDRFSPYARLLAGLANVARPETQGWRGAGGASLGIVTYLHEKVDLHVEARAIVDDRAYGQALLGLNIKVDRLLSTFAAKLRDFGFGTFDTAVEATGTAIKATGEGLEGIVKGVSSPFRKDRGQDQTPPEATPAPTPSEK